MHRSQGLIAIHHDCGGVRDAICRRCKPAVRNAEPVGGPGTRAFASDLLRSFSHRFLFSSSQLSPAPRSNQGRGSSDPDLETSSSSVRLILFAPRSRSQPQCGHSCAPPIAAAWSSVAPLGMAGWGGWPTFCFGALVFRDQKLVCCDLVRVKCLSPRVRHERAPGRPRVLPPIKKSPPLMPHCFSRADSLRSRLGASRRQ